MTPARRCGRQAGAAQLRGPQRGGPRRTRRQGQAEAVGPRRDGLSFKRLTLPFTSDASFIRICESLVRGEELGASAEGLIRKSDGAVDITGTIIPAYGPTQPWATSRSSATSSQAAGRGHHRRHLCAGRHHRQAGVPDESGLRHGAGHLPQVLRVRKARRTATARAQCRQGDLTPSALHQHVLLLAHRQLDHAITLSSARSASACRPTPAGR